MKIYYMSGAGNDFAVIDARDLQLDLQETAKSLCARLGSDGFMALDHSQRADFRLHFYNPDGLRGEMCGNGARCICHFARLMGIVGDSMTVETDAGIVYGWYLGGEQYRIRLNLPGLVDLERRPDAAYVELGDPGIPHSVTFLDALDYSQKEALRPLALDLRHDPVFPKGVNVNLCARLDGDTIRILTFERGVEDYTLACGTGSASTAVVLWYRGELPGGRLTVENPGGRLTVTIEGKATIENIYLEGPATLLKQYEA